MNVNAKSSTSTANQGATSFSLSPMNFEQSNLSAEWKNFIIKFKIFIRASGLEDAKDNRKVALFLHHMGLRSLEIFQSFNLDLDTVSFVNLEKKIEFYFVPKSNIAWERHKFFTKHQSNEESIEQYCTILKNLSLSCDFGELREELVRDIFICGLSNSHIKIKERLLNEGSIPLDKAYEIAKTMDLTNAQSKEISFQSSPSSTEHTLIGALSSNNKNSSSAYNRRTQPPQESNQNTSKYCDKCGQVHRYPVAWRGNLTWGSN